MKKDRATRQFHEEKLEVGSSFPMAFQSSNLVFTVGYRPWWGFRLPSSVPQVAHSKLVRSIGALDAVWVNCREEQEHGGCPQPPTCWAPAQVCSAAVCTRGHPTEHRLLVIAVDAAQSA